MATDLVTYIIDKMRVVPVSGKTAENNPERIYTVHGIFWSTEHKNGKLVRKDRLSIVQKNLDESDVLADGFAVDTATGTLTIPQGRKGRRAFAGLSQEQIMADLAALRGETSDDESDEPEPEPNV